MLAIPFEKRGFIPTLRDRVPVEDEILDALGPNPVWTPHPPEHSLRRITRYADVRVGVHAVMVQHTTGICRDCESRHILAWFRHTLWERMILQEIRHQLRCDAFVWSGPPPDKYVCGDPQRVARLIVPYRGWTNNVWLWPDIGLATHADTGTYLAWFDPQRIAAEIQHAAGLPRESRSAPAPS